VQLSDDTELMLYRMRKKDGSVDPFSSGTFVDAKGRATYLRSMDFAMTPTGETWKSPETGATYPIAWSLAVPRLGLQMKAETDLKSQELASHSGISPNYWEGAMRFQGTRENTPVRGVGYLEMTGYDAAVGFNPNGRE
jgi:predicted secreted hydrolase